MHKLGGISNSWVERGDWTGEAKQIDRFVQDALPVSCFDAFQELLFLASVWVNKSILLTHLCQCFYLLPSENLRQPCVMIFEVFMEVETRTFAPNSLFDHVVLHANFLLLLP